MSELHARQPSPRALPAGTAPLAVPRLRLKTLLLVLLLAVLLPSLGIGSYATWSAVRAGQAAAESRLVDCAAALALAVDREIAGYRSAASALATSRSLDGPLADLATFDAQARRVADALGTSLLLVEAATMRQVVNTALPQGVPVNLIPAADYRPAVLTRQPLVTPLVRGTVSGRPVVGVAVPVVRGGRVPYVLTVRLPAERLQELLAAQALPPGTFGSITDARETVVARSDALHEQLSGQQVPAGVRARYEGRDSGLFHARTLDGLQRVIAFQSIPVAPGWRVFVAEPESVHAAAWRVPLLALSAGGVALVVAASLLSVLAARKVLRPVRELSRHAHALANGGTGVSAAALAPASILELEQLRRGLAQAEAAIEARGQALAQLAATLDLAVAFVRDPDGTIRYWSRGCEELYGWTAQEAVGRSAHALLRTVFPVSPREVALALEREGRWAGDLHHTTRDGRELVVAVRKALRRDGQGRPLSVVETLTDVTAARQAEAALERSNEEARTAAERLQLALEAGAIIGTWMWDLPSDAFTVDERFAESVGIDPVLGRAGLSLAQVVATVHPEDLPGLRAAIAEAVARGGPCSHEYRVRGRDGVYRWVQANGRVELAADGTPLRFPGVLLGVERRRALEAERDQATRLLRAFADAVPGVVYAKDREGRLLVANRGAAELIGKPPERFLGKTDREFLDDPAQAEAVMANDRRIMDSGVAEQVEEVVNRPGGEPTVWLSTKGPFRDAQGRVIGIIGASIDITARKAAEAALAGLNATLEQQVRQRTAELEGILEERKALEDVLRRRTSQAEAASHAKSAFLAHMSHEFRTPLNAVIGLSQLLQQRALPQDVGRFVGHIHAAGEQLLALVSDVLDLSRIESGEMVLESVAFEPQALLETVLALVRPQADAKALMLACEVQAELPERLVGDPMRLRQVLLNLLSNAVKFTAHGSVTLRVRPLPIDDAYLMLRLEVADSGIGIEPAQQQRVFEPFTQADGSITRRFGGTGLGLSIVRHLVGMMGGTLALHSVPGKGSVFSVALPLRRG